MPDAEELPVEVADNELIARAIFSPFHISSKGKIRPEAFKPPRDRNDVSVNRLRALSDDQCKSRAANISGDGKTYKGFAVLCVIDVRECGSDVVDTRELYFGHADIIHPVQLEENAPAAAPLNYKLKQLARKAALFLDPNPDAPDWQGEKLTTVA